MPTISGRMGNRKTKQILHDLRKLIPTYLKNDNENILLLEDKFYKISQHRQKNIRKFVDTIKKINKDLVQEIIEDNKKYVKEFNEEIEIKNNQIKKENPNLNKTELKKLLENKKSSSIRKNTKFFNSGIFTFSEEMKEDYKNNPNEFHKRMKIFKKEFEEEYKTKITHMTLHLDEKTPHVHFDFINYNFETHKTLRKNLTIQDFRDYQDFNEKIFKGYGQGYKRGKDKRETNNVHIDIKQSHMIEEFKNIVNEIIEKNKLPLNDLIDIKDKIKLLAKNSNEHNEKENYKIQLKELTKQINLHKKLNKNLEKYIKDIVKKNSVLGMKNWDGIYSDISKLIEEHNKNIMNENLKLESKVFNLEKLVEEMKNNKDNYTHKELYEENQELEKKVEDLEIETIDEDLETEKKEHSITKTKLEEKNKFNIQLLDKNRELEIENLELQKLVSEDLKCPKCKKYYLLVLVIIEHHPK